MVPEGSVLFTGSCLLCTAAVELDPYQSQVLYPHCVSETLAFHLSTRGGAALQGLAYVAGHPEAGKIVPIRLSEQAVLVTA